MWHITNANYIILTLLASSVIINMFYSGRETSDWWKDRRTGNFMVRLGVGPNQMMSKAIYLEDINDAAQSQLELKNNSKSKW